MIETTGLLVKPTHGSRSNSPRPESRQSVSSIGDDQSDILPPQSPIPKPPASTRSPFHILLGLAISFRMILLLFSIWQEETKWPDGNLRFTDVDYDVFTDAAKAFVADENLYAARPTYRYSPLLAVIISPGHWLLSAYSSSVTRGAQIFANLWGKLVFMMADLVCAWLQLKVSRSELAVKDPASLTSSERTILFWIYFGWLLNPLTAAISVRGNAEALIGASVLACLVAVVRNYAFVAGLLFGLAIHLKIYPVIYAPAIYLWFAYLAADGRSPFAHWRSLLPTRSHFVFALASVLSLASLTVWTFAYFGGWLAVEQAYLYHFKRIDIRHNFAPHFYPLYLLAARLHHLEATAAATTAPGVGLLDRISGWFSSAAVVTDGPHKLSLSWLLDSPDGVKLVLQSFSLLSLVISLLLVVALSCKLYRQPGLCWFVVTFSFVTFNKVCTSQYFVWSLVLLPTAIASLGASKRPTKSALFFLTLSWLAGQGLWLLAAYHLEFSNQPLEPLQPLTWPLVWVASLLFFAINIGILRYFTSMRSPKELVAESRLYTPPVPSTDGEHVKQD